MLFLLACAGPAFLFMVFDAFFPGLGYFLAERYFPVPSLLFFGSALTQRLSSSAKAGVILAAVAVLWFSAVHVQHHLSGMGTSPFGYFMVAYLLAFPYASVTEDGEENTGLKWIGIISVGCSLLLALFAGMLLLDLVPEVLASEIFWDGARLNAIWHPNTGACNFMIGIGFSLYFFFRTPGKWTKVLCILTMAVLFGSLVLTNSRTTLLVTGALIGGALLLKNGSRKHFLIGAVAIVVVIVALFLLSGTVFDLHTEARIDKLLSMEAENDEASASQTLWIDDESGEVRLQGQSGQGAFTHDMWTLNGRTPIWRAAFTVLQDNPTFKTWGTEYVAEEISYRINFSVAHAHNSWIQVLLRLGVPGLLVALAYTGIAIWNSMVLLWRKEAKVTQRLVAILVLCILMASFLENYLFVCELSTLFVNFIFFFCTGYLHEWCRVLPDKKTV